MTTAEQGALLQQKTSQQVQEAANLTTEAIVIEKKKAETEVMGKTIVEKQQEITQRNAELAGRSAMILRMGGDTSRFNPLATAHAQKDVSELKLSVEDYNLKVNDLSTEINAYNARVSSFQVSTEKLNIDIADYNKKIENFSNYLQKVAEGRNAVDVIDIGTYTYSGSGGDTVFGYSSSQDFRNMYGRGTSYWGEKFGRPWNTSEQWAIEGTKSYLGLGAEDVIRIGGKVVQESFFTPEQIIIANQVRSGRVSALAQWQNERALEQDRLKTGMLIGGTAQFSQPASYIEAYKGVIGNLPTTPQVNITPFIQTSEQLKAKSEMLSSPTAQFGDINFPSIEAAKLAQISATITPLGTEQFKFKSPESFQIPEYKVSSDIQAKLLAGTLLTPIEQRELYKQGLGELPSLYKSQWQMPIDINPETGKGYAAPDLEFQAHAPFIKQSEWYEQLSTQEKVLAIVGSMNFEIWSKAIQNEYGDNVKHEESKYIPNVSKFASFIEGFDPMGSFSLESASMGNQKIIFTKLPEPPTKDLLAANLYSYYDKDKPTNPLPERIETGLYKGVTSDVTIAMSSALGIGLVAGGIGKGIALTAGVRAANIAMKGVGYGIAGYVGTDVGLKALSGNIGGAAIEAGVFIGTLPYATAGYRFAAGITTPERMSITDIMKGKSIEIPEGLTAEKAIKFEAGAKLAIELGNMESPTQKPLDFTQVKSLGGFGKEVEMWIRENPQQSPIIGGSAAAKAQFREARLPGDIDIDVLNPKEAALSLYPKAQSFFGTENVKLDVNEQFNQATIEIRGQHGIQFIEKLPDVVIGQHTGLEEFGTSRPPIAIEGINYKPANELLLRKADSILRQQGETINPQPHRMKDIIDFESMANEFITAKQVEADKSWWLLRGFRESKVDALKTELETYKMYSGLDIYPSIRATVRHISQNEYGLIGAGLGALNTIVNPYPRVISVEKETYVQNTDVSIETPYLLKYPTKSYTPTIFSGSYPPSYPNEPSYKSSYPTLKDTGDYIPNYYNPEYYEPYYLSNLKEPYYPYIPPIKEPNYPLITDIPKQFKEVPPPRFDIPKEFIGKKRKILKRKISSYNIKNLFTELEDIVGTYAEPRQRSRKGNHRISNDIFGELNTEINGINKMLSKARPKRKK